MSSQRGLNEKQAMEQARRRERIEMSKVLTENIQKHEVEANQEQLLASLTDEKVKAQLIESHY